MAHDHNHDHEHEERELITLVDEQGNETLFEISTATTSCLKPLCQLAFQKV